MTTARFNENNKEMDRLGKEGHKLMVAERNALLRITAENLGRRLGWQDSDAANLRRRSTPLSMWFPAAQ